MTPGPGPERPDREAHHQQQGDPAGQAVRKFDDGRDLRRPWDHHAVAERPMAATPGPGACGTDDRSPEDDGDVAEEGDPGVAGEAVHGEPMISRQRGAGQKACGLKSSGTLISKTPSWMFAR